MIAGGRSKDVEILEIGENQRICDPWPSLKGNPSDVAGGILNLGITQNFLDDLKKSLAVKK